MSKDRKRSMVWHFFHFTREKHFVRCKICKKEYKYFKNTTNLKCHLERLHPDSLLISPIKREESDEEFEIASTSNSQQSGKTAKAFKILATTTCTSTSTPIGIGQTTITPLKESINLKKMRLLGPSSSDNELPEFQIRDLNMALVKMVVSDYQPLRIVEDKGFQEFVKKLNPLYSMPTRKRLTTQLIPEYYQSEVEKLQQKLSPVEYVSVTTDLWISDTTNHYVTVSVHFLENSELRSNVLQTNEVRGNQNSSEIAEELQDIFNNWNINDKIVTVVSDNSENIKSSIIDYLQRDYIPCLAQALNVSVNEGLNQNGDLNLIIEKCRHIVEYFKQNDLAVETLMRIQLEMNTRQLNVKQDVGKSWNSTYTMLQRLLDIKPSIVAVMPSLTETPKMLTEEEWQTIEDCVSILKPFDLMMTVLSGEKYITLSSTIPLVRGLQFSAGKINCATKIGKSLKNDLLLMISNRLGRYEQDKVSAKATFLDPRYKKQAFGLQENANFAENWVLEELECIFDEDEISTPTPEANISQVESESENPAEDDMLWERNRIPAKNVDQIVFLNTNL
ncbi:hypothetical protein GWI33_004325 [Rhynchophorus ferrugineus]|uniref:BED-type domain-containing protein n=1 Tax=Rhynchophorus ferrugineus TaxID=354439 RepID=A0A834IUL0_RHYFE|nr:hypothetical protein GWI33_004325 [Rhynchophorus ferrugineus]